LPPRNNIRLEVCNRKTLKNKESDKLAKEGAEKKIPEL